MRRSERHLAPDSVHHPSRVIHHRWYTLFFASPGSLTILPHLQQHVPYNPLTDFTPIGLISSGPFLLLESREALRREG